jgi:hypothetical protein
MLAKSIINDPAYLFEMGFGDIELSDNAMSELVEHTVMAVEFAGMNPEIYFKKLLSEVIKDKKENGKK